MKKLRAPLVLLAVLLALGGLAKWDEWKTEKETATEKSKGKILDIKPEDVTALTYVSKASESAPDSGAERQPGEPAGKLEPVDAALAKQGDAWRVTKPVDAPADASGVTSLVKTLTDYSFASVVAETKDKWVDFG